MKKSKVSAAVAFDAVTPALIESVEGVLAYAAKNKYQASAVYAAHNQVFGLKETPEVCASCNIKRVAALRKWMADYRMFQVDSENAAANAQGQALTNVPRETLGDLDSILKEYGAPVFEDQEERDQWLNGLLTQNSLALMGFRQLDAEELEIVNAALVSEETDLTNVPRETLEDVYTHYGAAIGETPEEELAYLNTALGTHPEDAGTVTDENDRAILNDRFGVLEAQLFPNPLNGLSGEELKNAIDAAPKTGANDVNTSNTIAGGMDDQEGPEVLNLKNKKGEAFTGTFNSEDGVNGQLVDAEGNTLKPGTYSTDTGDSYAVQPGGKATYKNDLI